MISEERPLCQCHGEPMLRGRVYKEKRYWRCRLRHRAVQAKYLSQNKDAVLARQKTRRRLNPGSDEYTIRWRRENQDKIAESWYQYYQSHQYEMLRRADRQRARARIERRQGLYGIYGISPAL